MKKEDLIKLELDLKKFELLIEKAATPVLIYDKSRIDLSANEIENLIKAKKPVPFNCKGIGIDNCVTIHYPVVDEKINNEIVLLRKKITATLNKIK